jgi:hypothetical protein
MWSWHSWQLLKQWVQSNHGLKALLCMLTVCQLWQWQLQGMRVSKGRVPVKHLLWLQQLSSKKARAPRTFGRM